MWRRAGIYNGIKIQSNIVRYIPARHSFSLARFKTETTPLQPNGNDFAASMLELSSKRGMQVTWIGFASNVGLTVSKGTAGWFMNSASLLADAAHSLSDLFSDFVTLYTFKMSRKVPDKLYPYGYGKYETMGSLSVSAILIAGGLGIGAHSFELLLTTLQQQQQPSQQEILDPNAAWFALGSVLVKEWLYRITLKVGQSERSDVLIANAWHHRSDAYSSFVALVAIGGTYMGVPIFDPLGGMLVSGMILKSGADIMVNATQELMDKSIGKDELEQIEDMIATVKSEEIDLIDFHSLRGRKFGPFHHIDLTLQLKGHVSMVRANAIEDKVRNVIKTKCQHVQEVKIHLRH